VARIRTALRPLSGPAVRQLEPGDPVRDHLAAVLADRAGDLEAVAVRRCDGSRDHELPFGHGRAPEAGSEDELLIVDDIAEIVAG